MGIRRDPAAEQPVESLRRQARCSRQPRGDRPVAEALHGDLGLTGDEAEILLLAGLLELGRATDVRAAASPPTRRGELRRLGMRRAAEREVDRCLGGAR